MISQKAFKDYESLHLATMRDIVVCWHCSDDVPAQHAMRIARRIVFEDNAGGFWANLFFHDACFEQIAGDQYMVSLRP